MSHQSPPPTRLTNKIYSIDQILGHVKRENNSEVKSKSSHLLGLVTVYSTVTYLILSGVMLGKKKHVVHGPSSLSMILYDPSKKNNLQTIVNKSVKAAVGFNYEVV